MRERETNDPGKLIHRAKKTKALTKLRLPLRVVKRREVPGRLYDYISQVSHLSQRRPSRREEVIFGVNAVRLFVLDDDSPSK